MLHALRAALRLPPAGKSSTGDCSRPSLVRRGDQTYIFPLSLQKHAAVCERQPNTVTGLAGFAKAALAYVGVGLSAIAATQLSGPSTLFAKVVKREVCRMADEKSGSSWCFVPSNRCFSAQDWDKETSGCYRHDDMVPGGKGILISEDTIKKEVEEESIFFPNEHWGVMDDTDLPWQFGPSHHGSQCMTAEETTKSECQKISGIPKKQPPCDGSADINLEWQWIIDQQPPWKCESSPFNNQEKNLHSVSDEFQEDAGETVVKADKDTEVKIGSSGFSSFLKRPNISQELGATKFQPRESTSWRTADSKALAALVSQKNRERLENCDLPPSHSSVMWSLASCDFTPKTYKSNISVSVDKLFLASFLHGYEPSQLDNKPLSLSPLTMGMSDLTLLNQHPPQVSRPLAIPSILPQPLTQQHTGSLSSDDRNTRWNGSSEGSATATARGFDKLGEALCHSQTRARQAEKVAAQALQEKKQLERLFFREASICRTYKHWSQTIEIENMSLKMLMREESGTWIEDSAAFKWISNYHSKNLGKWLPRKKMHHHLSSLWECRDRDCAWFSEGNVMVGCTLGLAFALGLSFAGAGLMIGWSIGWILLAY